jgi:RHS repeat-associated protein
VASNNDIAVAIQNAYADHIDTVRMVTKQDNTLVWRWDTAEAFGATAPNQDPSGVGAFVYNPRFPGQVFDQETGLNQNWHREYNARLGRYIQSDPIGLAGGVSVYNYVRAMPVDDEDPDGLRSRLQRTSVRPDPARDAAGYHDIRGEIVCVEWSCPANSTTCGRGDSRSPRDFIPAAFNPATPPSGCTCARARYITLWGPLRKQLGIGMVQMHTTSTDNFGIYLGAFVSPGGRCRSGTRSVLE